MLFLSCVCQSSASVHCFLVVTCRERADFLAAVCNVYCDFVTFPFGILGQVWYLILSVTSLVTCIVARCLIKAVYRIACAFIRS